MRCCSCYALTFCTLVWGGVLRAEEGLITRSVMATNVSFELDVQPILTARGCNQGACHGKARGQNGFQLSLRGVVAESDCAALTKSARGRRLFPAAPEQSLLLRKAAGLMPHGGGVRIEPG